MTDRTGAVTFRGTPMTLLGAEVCIDREGVVRHRELVREITSEPNYSAVLEAVRELAR